jgi:hypothetical protein
VTEGRPQLAASELILPMMREKRPPRMALVRRPVSIHFGRVVSYFDRS